MGTALLLPAAAWHRAASAATPAATPGGPAAAPRHICFLLMEDMGLQCGPYGDTTVPTPQLDRLATGGCTFENALCTSTTCSPSRSSLFTGLYPHQNGHLGLASVDDPSKPQWGWRLHRGTPTLQAMLHDKGFAIGRTYKLHVAPEEAMPFDRVYDVDDFRKSGRAINHGDQIADFTADFFKQHADSPVFFIPQSTDTHRPFAWKSGGHNAPLTDKPGLPYEIKDAGDGLLLPHFGEGMPPEERLTGDVANYLNAVQRVDRLVGEVLDRLDALGIADETLVVFTSDHGPAYARGKCSVYELGVHVPLIVRWPGVSRPGSRVAAPVSLVDFMPTVLDALGMEVPTYMPGSPWRPLLDGTDDAAETRRSPYAVAEYHAHLTVNTWWPSRTITDGRWKLNAHLLAGTPEGAGGNVVTDNPPDIGTARRAPAGSSTAAVYGRFRNPPRFELFNLASDPHELVSLHDDPAAASELARLKSALEAWQLRTHDPFRDPAYLAAYTRHYRDFESRVERIAAEKGQTLWQVPHLLDGDHSRFLRDFDEVKPELLAALAGDPPAVEVPPPLGTPDA